MSKQTIAIYCSGSNTINFDVPATDTMQETLQTARETFASSLQIEKGLLHVAPRLAGVIGVGVR
ncbi:hypothetical protein E1B28_004939 [Marasmius oreades]|uniref:Uncharacterized protein n=1 Tax=Marasmius oreades TaxID=181124 RepID=A0A9P8ADS3_9AGAR|nr:uncharacterized protein E1B28_004939 [Marasmius oreades]KAG7097605.1 hypothetical protein E1B28_004939 [Marasmius oreades]